MAPNRAQSSKKRSWTAVIQGVCGLVAIACGIALILLKAEGYYIPSYVERLTRRTANIGFGIWGGVIISVTAILGLIYREKKAMISIYAAFSLVSNVVAVVLTCVSIAGLARIAKLNDSRCQLYYGYNYEFVRGNYECCFRPYRCDPYNDIDSHWTARTDAPWFDYDSTECRRMRSEIEGCRETIRKDKRTNMSLYAILLLVSVVEFIVSITAAVLAFIVVCRGCCKSSPQQVVYLAYSANGQPGSAPMVLIPSMDPGTPPMPGVVPNTMASPYPPQMVVMNPNMAPGLYPYPMPAAVPPGYGPGQVGTSPDNAVTDGTKQRETTPPPSYEAEQYLSNEEY